MEELAIIWDDADDLSSVCVPGTSEASSKTEKAMKMKQNRTPKWTAADRARHKAIREEFENCPTQEDMEASGQYEGPIKNGAYFNVRVLIHELKQARRTARLTLAEVARLSGMDQASLSRLENGHQPNPTVDTLWRYARAVGRRLVLSHSEAGASGKRNGKRPWSRRRQLARNSPEAD